MEGREGEGEGEGEGGRERDSDREREGGKKRRSGVGMWENEETSQLLPFNDSDSICISPSRNGSWTHFVISMRL